MEWYVNYTIDGKDYQAGPYSPDEADWHRKDIAGYDRVRNCSHMTAARDVTNVTPVDVVAAMAADDQLKTTAKANGAMAGSAASS